MRNHRSQFESFLYLQSLGVLITLSILITQIVSFPVPEPQQGFSRRNPNRPPGAPGPQNPPQSQNVANRPQVTYTKNPDGTFSASVSASQAINGPGTNGAFGFSQSYTFGPKGSSFSGSQTASLNGKQPGGNFGFSQSNSLSGSQGPNGFANAGSNSASSNFQNPLFSSSQANANAFANQANFNRPPNAFANQANFNQPPRF